MPQLSEDMGLLKLTPGLEWEAGNSPLEANILLLYPFTACFWKYCI